jgi:hypothetical protein
MAFPATSAGELFPSLLPWLLALLGLVIVGGGVLLLVRRWLRSDEADGPADVGFTLQDLRDMHRVGELSDEEFERAKSAMIEQVQRAAEERAARAGDDAAT